MLNLSSFNPNLQEVISKLGFEEFTPIQELAFPVVGRGENALIISPTGSGKTEAVILPVFDQLLRYWEKSKQSAGINILYITPLRALNRDIFKRVIDIGEQLGIQTGIRHSDTSQHERRQQTLNPPNMLITTPETLGIILTAKRLGESLRNVKWVIVDEIHELIDSKRGTQLFISLERLERLCKDSFQRIGLSATIGDPKIVANLLVGVGRKCEILEEPTIKALELEIIYPQPNKEDEELSEKIFSSPEATARAKKVIEIIDKNTSTLVFTNTRQFTEILGNRIRLIGTDFPFGVHHGSLSKGVRKEAEDLFKRGELKAIICTSSLELGIDIGSVDTVVQMMSSREIAPLLQRIGRSGHKIDKVSKGILITIDAEDIMESAVIGRRALKKQLEEPEPYYLPWEVLSHQITGILMEESPMTLTQLHTILKRAYPCKDLTEEDLQKLLQLMKELGTIWIEEEGPITRRKNTLHYYFNNLSPIRDIKRYQIYDVATNKIVGSLDDEFVEISGEVGTVFITKGVPWKILAIKDDRVEVAPVHTPIGAIPAFDGELIPVPYSVAQEVGSIRENVWQIFNEEDDRNKAKRVLKNYPIDDESKQEVINYLFQHYSEDNPMPSNNRIVIEISGNYGILHCDFGTKVNQTLGQLIGSLLMAKFACSIGIRSDTYRIILTFPYFLKPEHIEAALREIKGEFVEELLRRTIPQTTMYSWRFIHIAKRFGAIRGPWESGTIPPKRLARVYEGTLIAEATLDELLHDKLDIEQTKIVLERIQNQEITIETIIKKKIDEFSPLAISSLNQLRFTGFIMPAKPDRQLAEKVQERLQKKEIRLICMWCGKFNTVYTVENIDEKPKCTKCGARYLAAVSPRNEELYPIVKKHLRREALDEEEQKILSRGFKSADLVIASGKKAIIALAARGIGPASASRVLEKSYSKDDYEFYAEIIEAEKEYSRTRPFWGD